jgi:Omp85 superfamily domain
MRIKLCGAARLASLAAMALCAAPAVAQGRDTVVVAGEQYAAGSLHEFFMGENYREAWTRAVRVEVLNPDTFAGGLTVEEEGGGFATESLRLKGRNGREYVFRSVDKRAERSLPEEFRGTVVNRVMQDMVSSKHPGIALIVPPLLEAVGVLHVSPRMMVMPDHPFLGKHRQRFAGMLGQVEERPTDGNGVESAAFAGTDDVEGSEDFRKELEDDPEHRLDSRKMLTARLMDVLLGDWDRHWDQWRWAREDRGEMRVWQPIPRDRDAVATDQRGLIGIFARMAVPMVTKFGPTYDDVFGLVIHASEVDRTLLSDLSRAEWDSTAAFIQQRLTDRVIEDAVRRLPPEYQATDAQRFAADLKGRRDRLPEAAREFYRLLATEVDVYATDKQETAEITRLPDGSVEVVITSEDEGRRLPYFRRRFVPAETREVRVFLRGGDDRARIVGAVENSLMVRIIGGGGDDELVDESRVGGRGDPKTVFHDDRGKNRFQPGVEARVDERTYDPGPRSTLIRNAPPPRDWGSDMSWMTPYLEQDPTVGPVLGFGPTWTRYGFRRTPYARMIAVRALWTPWEGGGYGAEVFGDWRHTNRPTWITARARASTFNEVRFHGFGNDSPDDPGNRFVYDQTQVVGEALYHARPSRRAELYAGPVAKWTDPEIRFGATPDGPSLPFSPETRGAEEFSQLGARLGGRLDLRDTTVFPRSGFLLFADGAAYGSDVGTFGTVYGQASTYASLLGRAGPVLALRLGGGAALGDFPLQEAAFVGGPMNLRGYPYRRFTGEQAVFGSAEARQRLGRVNLFVARPVVGVFALADAGRVFSDQDVGDDLHTAFGGGLTFELVGQILTLTYARGEYDGIYFQLGHPF